MKISGTSFSLIEYAHQLLALAEKEGAEEAEVFGLCGRAMEVDLRKSVVDLASESTHCGLGLRAVVKGAVGFSSTSNMNQLKSVARSAVKTARVRDGDELWRSLPLPEQVVRPERIFDVHLEKIEAEECLDLAAGMLAGCAEVPGVEPVSGTVACTSGTEMVINTRGVDLQEASTLMYASMETIARGQDVATGSEFQNSRSLLSNLEEVGSGAAQMARASLGGTKAESGTFHVLLKPLAFAELLENTLLPSVSADSVQKGRSALKGRIGELIASEHLRLLDDGLLSGGMASSAFDGEGVPSQQHALLDDGVLQGFLYDSYTAGKDGVRSTGNAVRGGYSDISRVGIRNLRVSSSEAHDLLAETRGFTVAGLIGAHTANSISGDFSVEAGTPSSSSREKRPDRYGP